jgi:hypothetical protein
MMHKCMVRSLAGEVSGRGCTMSLELVSNKVKMFGQTWQYFMFLLQDGEPARIKSLWREISSLVGPASLCRKVLPVVLSSAFL